MLVSQARTKVAIQDLDSILPLHHRFGKIVGGVYYTPDYIVQYIIEQTVGPVLREKFAALLPKFRQFQEKIRQVQHTNRERKKAHLNGEDEKNIYRDYQWLTEELFDLKVLDPAMGSGHFLVDAVDYITDKIIEFLRPLQPNPVHYGLQEMKLTIAVEAERQGVTIDRSKLTEIHLLKRQVLKRCIYGVDLNRMAVELTKISLWLDTFTVGAPLSFLDHHLKWGNSLIGAQIDQARNTIEEQRQLSMFGSNLWTGMLLSVKGMLLVSHLSDNTPGEARASQEAYAEVEKHSDPGKRLLNVYLSRWFSNPFTKGKKGKSDVDKAIDLLRSDEAEQWFKSGGQTAFTQEQQVIFDNAQRDFENYRFFHWELEFPEVFIDLQHADMKVNPGFDAVIGNPPYVRQEGLGRDKPFFKDIYTVYDSIADLYTYFIERGHQWLQQAGRFGMITANKFMRANYGAPLRAYLTGGVRLEQLIDFGDLPVFEDAITYPVVIVSAKAERDSVPIKYALINSTQFANLASESLASVVVSTASKMPESAFSGSNWSLAPIEKQSVLDKIKLSALPLEKYTGGVIRRGILTGLNEAFVLDGATRDRLIAEDPKSIEIIKPFLIGEDARRYSTNFQRRYLLWTFVGVPINLYPAIFKHLQQYQTALEERWDKGNYWWELRHCDYYADFEKPKIVYPNICMQPEFTFDDKGYYSNQKTFIIPMANTYLLAILNSTVMKFIFNIVLPKLRGNFFEPSYVFMKDIPIRCINFITSDEERARYLNEARQLYRQYLDTNNRECVLNFVNHHLSQEPEASDIVHDLLAFLAEEMLHLNKEKRAGQQAFLAWLAGTLKIQPQPDRNGRTGIDALQGKSTLLNYLGDYQKGESERDFVEIRHVLQENKQRLGVYLSETLLAQVEEHYQESLATLRPLKQQLARTDTLIDRVVYQLYGLTEDEIGVVEKRA